MLQTWEQEQAGIPGEIVAQLACWSDVLLVSGLDILMAPIMSSFMGATAAACTPCLTWLDTVCVGMWMKQFTDFITIKLASPLLGARCFSLTALSARHRRSHCDDGRWLEYAGRNESA